VPLYFILVFSIEVIYRYNHPFIIRIANISISSGVNSSPKEERSTNNSFLIGCGGLFSKDGS